MADIKNKNELKRRTELFIDEFSHEEYIANEDFCKDTMRMVREFIGRACHLLDCKDVQIEKAKKKARAKAIDEVFDFLKTKRDKKYMRVDFDDLEIRKYKEQLKEGGE